HCCASTRRPQRRATLLPYTTLFRSPTLIRLGHFGHTFSESEADDVSSNWAAAGSYCFLQVRGHSLNLQLQIEPTRASCTYEARCSSIAVMKLDLYSFLRLLLRGALGYNGSFTRLQKWTYQKERSAPVAWCVGEHRALTTTDAGKLEIQGA